MSRPDSSNPITALRAALAGPYPTLRRAAMALIRRALREPTFADTARALGVNRHSLDNLRRDYPEVFAERT